MEVVWIKKGGRGTRGQCNRKEIEKFTRFVKDGVLEHGR